MENEIKAAVDWWSNQLRGTAKQDNGDGFQSFALSFIADRAPKPTEEQIGAFSQALAKEIRALIDTEHWRPENPIWGGYGRTVCTDYDPDCTLAAALKDAGISTNLLPCKTVMWINPGSVKVSCGYGAGIEELYSAEIAQCA